MTDVSRIVERIVRKTGLPGLVDALTDLGASDLQSLLLDVYRRRAEAGSVGGLVDRYRKSRFTKPSANAPQHFVALDALAYRLLPEGFEAIELSPVAPFGATSMVAGTSQNRIVSTIRNSEVAADSTNALALECAVRRSALLEDDPRSHAPVKLAASQRLVRAQEFKEERHTAHFRLFGLCTAGRDAGSFGFELEQLNEHAGFHVALVKGWLAHCGTSASIRVPVTALEDGPPADVVEERVIAPLAERHPDVEPFLFPEREQGIGYYRKACFHVYVEAPDGTPVQLADGGLTDWTQQLVGSRKERLMISGIGTEGLVGIFASELPA